MIPKSLIQKVKALEIRTRKIVNSTFSGNYQSTFKGKGINRYPIISLLNDLIEDWQPSKKPMSWYDCPKLSRNINKKWEIKKWQDWIAFNKPIN